MKTSSSTFSDKDKIEKILNRGDIPEDVKEFLRRGISEHEKNQEKSEKKQDKLISILNSMEDGVYIVNQQHDIQYVNPALKKEFGTAEGRKCYRYFHERKEPCPWCKNEMVFKGETVRWEWYSFKTKKTYDLIDTPLRNDDGSISKLEIFRDITERKQAEQQIRKQKNFLQNILESIDHPFYVIDATDYTIKMANSAAQKHISGKNQTCYAITHGRSKPCGSTEHPCPLEETKRTKKHAITEHIHHDKDGNDINVEVHGYPIFDDKDNIVQMITYYLDVTERKKAEEILRASEEKFRTVVKTTPDIIMTVNLKGEILFINRTVPGFTLKQTIGTSVYDYILPEYHDTMKNAIKQVFKTGRNHRLELMGRGANNTTVWYENRIGAIKRDEQVIAVTMISTDLTERKQTEKSLADKNIALKEVLEQITIEKDELKEKINTTLEKLVVPKLLRLKSKVSDSEKKQVELIEKNIQAVSSSFGKKISRREIALSPREIEVCDMIKSGLKNKGIAEELGISLKTVESIRKNIRRKLKIRNKQVNLRTYLQSL